MRSSDYLFLPHHITLGNSKESIKTLFIEFDATEYLDHSTANIARKLNRRYEPYSVPHLNATKRDHDIPNGLNEHFIANHQLGCAIYNYVLSKYKL